MFVVAGDCLSFVHNEGYTSLELRTMSRRCRAEVTGCSVGRIHLPVSPRQMHKSRYRDCHLPSSRLSACRERRLSRNIIWSGGSMRTAGGSICPDRNRSILVSTSIRHLLITPCLLCCACSISCEVELGKQGFLTTKWGDLPRRRALDTSAMPHDGTFGLVSTTKIPFLHTGRLSSVCALQSAIENLVRANCDVVC